MKNTKPFDTALEPHEAQTVINIVSQVKVNLLDETAIQQTAILQSILRKCGTIVRTAQPLASAAKPKKDGAEAQEATEEAPKAAAAAAGPSGRRNRR